MENKSIIRNGFTLTEVVIGFGILLILAGLGIFLTMDFYRGYAFNYEKNLIISLLQKARSESMSNINQAKHGFCFSGSDYILFEGEDCDSGIVKERFSASKNMSFDFSHLSPNLNGGLNEVVFEQVNGDARTTGYIEIGGFGHAPVHISVNEEGRINY